MLNACYLLLIQSKSTDVVIAETVLYAKQSLYACASTAIDTSYHKQSFVCV